MNATADQRELSPLLNDLLSQPVRGTTREPPQLNPWVTSTGGTIQNNLATEASKPLSKWAHDLNTLPSVKDAVQMARAAIEREHCEDVPDLELQQVRMAQDGGIYYDPDNGDWKSPMGAANVGITGHALGQLAAFLDDKPERVKAVLEWADPHARAALFNDLTRRAKQGRKLTLRTIKPVSQVIVRGVVTPMHSRESGDDLVLLDIIEKFGFPPGAKMRWTRTWRRTDAKILVPTQLKEVTRGRVVMAMYNIRNSEVKACSGEITGGAFDLVCLNGQVAENTSVTVRHVGDIKTKLRVGFTAATSIIQPLVEGIEHSYRDPFPEALPTRAAVLERVGKVFGGLFAEDVLETAGKVWDADGEQNAGDTRAGLVNALTRAAQEKDMEVAEVIEGLGGRISMDGWKALGIQ